MSSFLLTKNYAASATNTTTRWKARTSAIRIPNSGSSNNATKNDSHIRRRLISSSSRSFHSSPMYSSSSLLLFNKQDCCLLKSSSSNNKNNNAFQTTRSMSSVWGYFFPSPNDENNNNNNQNEAPEIVMPPRQQYDQSSSSRTRTIFDKDEMEVQNIIGQKLGTLTDETWSNVEILIKRLLASNNINIAFWLLDRLSKEPNSSTMLSTEEMIYPVFMQWFQAYVSQQRKRHRNFSTPNEWEQRSGSGSSSSSGSSSTHPSSKNRLYGPRTVWKKLDSYRSKGGIQLTNRFYNRLIDATAYANVKNLGSPHGPELADTILQCMIDLSSIDNNQSTGTKIKSGVIRPTRITFNAVIASWESAAMNFGPRSDAYDRAAKRSLELLHQLKSIYRDGYDPECMPNRETYLRVMRLFAHQGNGDKVEELMEEMYSTYLDHSKHQAFLPTIDFFSLVVFAWSRSKDPDAPERALEIFERILELEAKQEIPGLEVTSRAYNVALLCIGFAATEEAGNKMESLFEHMVELSKLDPNKRPNSSTYAALASGWSRIDPSRAEQVLSMWKEEAEAGNCTMAIDGKMLGVLIGGWYNSNAPNSPEMCEKLLQDAIQQGMEVSASSFDMTINAWCRKKTRDAAFRAESLLRQIQEYEDEQHKSDLKATIYTYAPIIFCHANLDEAVRAEALLREFFERYPEKERGFTRSTRKTRLDIRVINGVLESWLSRATKDSLAVERSERLLLDMVPNMQVHPNLASFELVLKCKQSQKNSPLGSQTKSNSRREEVIALLDDEYKNGNLRCKLEEYLTKRQAWIMFNA